MLHKLKKKIGTGTLSKIIFLYFPKNLYKIFFFRNRITRSRSRLAIQHCRAVKLNFKVKFITGQMPLRYCEINFSQHIRINRLRLLLEYFILFCSPQFQSFVASFLPASRGEPSAWTWAAPAAPPAYRCCPAVGIKYF